MQEPFQLEQNDFFTIKNWQEEYPHIWAGFSSRREGVSKAPYQSNNLGLHVGDDVEKVLFNREQLATSLGISLSRWVYARQTHGHHIHRVTEKDRGRGSRDYDTGIPATDGLYTDEKGIMLALAFADCVPLYFFAPQHLRVGIAHAGWRGTVANIGFRMVEQWARDGIPPEEVVAIIGPAICQKCYRVDEKVISAAHQLPIPVDPFYQTVDGNEYTLDLKALNRALLEYAGVFRENIHVSRYCTSCGDGLFFSHRRDGRGQTGRMLGFIGIKEDG